MVGLAGRGLQKIVLAIILLVLIPADHRDQAAVRVTAEC
jgi:hypothetical protein